MNGIPRLQIQPVSNKARGVADFCVRIAQQTSAYYD